MVGFDYKRLEDSPLNNPTYVNAFPMKSDVIIGRDPSYWEKEGIEKPQRTIVASACRHPIFDILLISPRHWDRRMHGLSNALDSSIPLIYNVALYSEGFVDQYGDYHNRIDALKIAVEAKQKISERGCGGSKTMLYSEGLW
jgi:hypothetical protein